MLAVLAVLVTPVQGLFTRIDVLGLDRRRAAKFHLLEPCRATARTSTTPSRPGSSTRTTSCRLRRRRNQSGLLAARADLRRAGGFFLRRSFDGDPLAPGVPQLRPAPDQGGRHAEFFIEARAPRTGKTPRPRLGMLRMVPKLPRAARQDVYLVPSASPTSGWSRRLIASERGGARVARESLALLRAHGAEPSPRQRDLSARRADSLARHLGDAVPRRRGARSRTFARNAKFGVEISRSIDGSRPSASSRRRRCWASSPAPFAKRSRERVGRVVRLLEAARRSLGVPVVLHRKRPAGGRARPPSRPERGCGHLRAAICCGSWTECAARSTCTARRSGTRWSGWLRSRWRFASCAREPPYRGGVGLARPLRRRVLPGRRRREARAAGARARAPGLARLSKRRPRTSFGRPYRASMAGLPARAAHAAGRGVRERRARGARGKGRVSAWRCSSARAVQREALLVGERATPRRCPVAAGMRSSGWCETDPGRESDGSGARELRAWT